MSVGAQQQRAAGTGAPAREVRPRWWVSAHALRLTTLALAALIIAVITRRPEFAGVAAPAVLLLAARRPERPARIGLSVRPSTRTVVEGEEADLAVEVTGHGDHSVDLLVYPRFTVEPEPGGSLQAGRESGLPFRVSRAGRRSLGALEITLRDRWRLTEGRALVELPVIDCYPRPARQDTTVVLSRLPSRLGEHASRSPGEGTEFTGVREFVPGDRQRRINWPATTRHGTLHLSTFSAERTQNVVVIADATTDVGEQGSSTLDLVLRGASGAVRHYLARRDRVGVIIYAGRLSWIGPGLGQRHFQRLIDLLASSPVGWERAAELTRLPRAALPPGALVLVFSPLLDHRLVEAVRDLRERGFSVVVVDVLNAEPAHDGSRISGLTARVWRLEQQAIRYSLKQLGVPVVHWDGVSSLDEPLAPYSRRVLVVRR